MTDTLVPRTQRLERDPRIRRALLSLVGALVVLALVSPGPALPTRLQDGLTLSISVLIESMPFVLLGVLLSIAVQVLVPRDALLAIGSNPALSIVAMILLAMIVSICSNVDSFFALSFAATFTPGSIVAFLLVGPLVDVKMLSLLRTTFRTRALAALVVIVVLFAIAAGSVVNLFA